ncbi:hypothetical protein [Burkholderia cenocepacia]|uniref:hypothetical protein n=1 Tax=Burkholderia cenocepacia TaxID=95486 RepID=UPI00264DD36A|nr:hypothetical protein [Burkholderia cenocepacia]MDN7541966.1 hypothetical protein [Burkholderia cenocepacia]
MKKPRAVFIPIPLYGGEVVLCRTRKEWDAVADKLGVSPDDTAFALGITHALESTDGGRIYMIGVFDGAIPTLAHELLHAAIATLDHVGIPINSDTDEALTYLFDHLLAAALPLFIVAGLRPKKGRG